MDALLEQTGSPSWGRLAAYIGLLWLAQRVVAAAHYFYRARTAPGRYLLITPFTILSDLVPKLGSVGTMTVWRAHADSESLAPRAGGPDEGHALSAGCSVTAT
jgi:hypothetical protein